MKNYSQISEMSAEKIIGLLKSTATKISSGNLELGKLLVALDEKREGKGTLKKFVRENTGLDIPDHAFCCAVVFRAMVGTEKLEESIYDLTPLKWLLQVSAIVNLLEKSSKDEAAKSVILTQVCEILRTKPDGGEALLKKIKDSLRAPDGGETEGGEGDSENVVELSADLLSVDHLKAIGKAVFDCNDIAKLETVAKAFRSILDIAEGRLDEVRQSQQAAA